MVYHELRGVIWLIYTLLTVCLALPATAQQATKSDADLIREGPLALAAAHGDKPRYGGKFLSAGNEKVPHYDMHQTSFGGIYAATAPAYNCLVRTSPYDSMALDVVPELAQAWEISDSGKII
jgi:ABC-type transport system substrate-binding protein